MELKQKLNIKNPKIKALMTSKPPSRRTEIVIDGEMNSNSLIDPYVVTKEKNLDLWRKRMKKKVLLGVMFVFVLMLIMTLYSKVFAVTRELMVREDGVKTSVSPVARYTYYMLGTAPGSGRGAQEFGAVQVRSVTFHNTISIPYDVASTDKWDVSSAKDGSMATLSRKPTIRLETVSESVSEVLIRVIIKSTTELVELKVNGSEYDYKEDGIDYESFRQNNEITTTFGYMARINGIFVFEVQDKKGNVTIESIAVSTITEDKPEITCEVIGATALSRPQIVFTSVGGELIRVVGSYEHITFEKNSYDTMLRAVVNEDITSDMTFTFENKAGIRQEVKVSAPISTKVQYVRFAGDGGSLVNMSEEAITQLSKNVTSSQVFLAGKTYSYYGFGSTKPKTSAATENELDVADILGSANKTYRVDLGGKTAEMKEQGKATTSSASGYTNGNITGVSRGIRSGTFKLKLVP